eukprot:525427-Hanusia_phi.AAC.1
MVRLSFLTSSPRSSPLSSPPLAYLLLSSPTSSSPLLPPPPLSYLLLPSPTSFSPLSLLTSPLLSHLLLLLILLASNRLKKPRRSARKGSELSRRRSHPLFPHSSHNHSFLLNLLLTLMILLIMSCRWKDIDISVCS